MVNKVAGVTRIQITFSEDVDIHPGDITVIGTNSGAQPFVLAYDGNTFKATLTFAAKLPDRDAYVISATNGIVDTAGGNALVPASFTVKTLIADVTGDGWVNNIDMWHFRKSFGKNPGDPDYDERCDFTGDGPVNNIDMWWLRKNWAQRAP